ncbi:MAG: peptidoglycan DD-metalloendopeptidase family protein [Erysipelotrichaceae bacterium]
MKKKILFMILLLLFIFPTGSNIKATDFEGNESYYRTLCSKEGADEGICSEFESYIRAKADKLQNEVNNMNKELQKAKGDLSALGKLVTKYQGQIEALEASIAGTKNSIAIIQDAIARIDVQILEVKSKIDARNDQIKKRMVAEQPLIGTNMYFDFIMGSKNLLELVRNVDGVQEITKNDKKQIELMKEDKKKMDLMKDDQKRLEEQQTQILAQEEIDKKVVEEMKAKTLESQNILRSQEAIIEAKMREVQVKIDDVIAFMPNRGGLVGDVSNAGFIRPIQGAYISAGTWYYPSSFGGGVHLGVDYAVGRGTPIVAPAEAFVMYANNPCASTGFYGSQCGYPYGGGNTVHLLTSVNGVNYGLNFYHLQQNNLYAIGKNRVFAGDVIGLVGSSGNSTGPHSHIEVVKLNVSLNEAADYFSRTADFSYGTGWRTPGGCSNLGCRIKPESVFP